MGPWDQQPSPSRLPWIPRLGSFSGCRENPSPKCWESHKTTSGGNLSLTGDLSIPAAPEGQGGLHAKGIYSEPVKALLNELMWSRSEVLRLLMVIRGPDKQRTGCTAPVPSPSVMSTKVGISKLCLGSFFLPSGWGIVLVESHSLRHCRTSRKICSWVCSPCRTGGDPTMSVVLPWGMSAYVLL